MLKLIQTETDFFATCLREVETLLVEQGWCRSYVKWEGATNSENTSLDLTQAIELIAEQYYVLAPDMGYQDLGSLVNLSAEMKAYLHTLTPARGTYPYERMTIAQFNDIAETDLTAVRELLEFAYEKYRPERAGYRHRDAKDGIPNSNIYWLDSAQEV